MADIALYRAKADGRNQFRYFDEPLKQNLRRDLDIETNLPNALANGEFVLYYQPIVDSVRKYCKKVEVSIRWMSDNGQLHEPEVFIPIAETTGFIHSLGGWIFETALCEMSDWLKRSDQNTVCFKLTQSELDVVSLPETVLHRIDVANIARHQPASSSK